MLNLIIFLSPIQSFVLTNVVKGLTFFNILVLFLMIRKFLFNKSFRLFIFIFTCFYFLFFLFSQLSTIFDFLDNNFNNIIFVSTEVSTKLDFRASFFTQSVYLYIVVSFFYFLLKQEKYVLENIINFAFLSIIIFSIYGYFEVIMYMFTGHNFDYISNRITGEDFQVGLFQIINIGGLTLQRMKSLAGEPSMFAFTILPFFIFAIYLKRYITSIFIFITLVLSTSTSAVIGIVIWIILEMIYGKQKILKLFILLILFMVLMFLFYDMMFAFYEIIETKLKLNDTSGMERFTFFSNHFNTWLNSNFINILFGYGFGYARSTDGLSTLLFNVGLIGTILYIMFFMLPFFLIRNKNAYIKGLFISNTTLLIVILISVPEFYYPHIWLFNALLWNKYLEEKKDYIK